MGKSKKTVIKRNRGFNYGDIRRENNKAVRKTRERKKFRHEETLIKIRMFKADNERLELRIQNLREQLDSLKEIYDEHERAETEKIQKAEPPVITTETLEMDTAEDEQDDYEIDEEKYDHLRQILNEVNILNNS